jgi:hypothetical protein
VKGKLVKADLGGGGWVLEADDGKRYQLAGDVPKELAGRRVEVRGKAAESFGFLMTGDPTLEVERITAL